jgi:hypothetical protein
MSDHTRSRRVLAGVVVVVTATAGVLLLCLIRESMTISGDAVAPVASTKVPLDVTFTNGYRVPVSVTELNVTVRGVTAPNADAAHPCTVADFAVDQLSSDVAITVGAGATSSLRSLRFPDASWPQVHLRDTATNQGSCAGASLTLAYTASRTWKFL